MSRKHFVALADALRAERPVSSDFEASEYAARLHQWEHDVAAVAMVCRHMNGMFNSHVFYGYLNSECGPNGGTR